MHLGLTVFVVGESTTPSIKKGDLLIAISGSGETDLTYEIVKNAKDAGSSVCLLTVNPNSRIANISDLIIEIKAKTKFGKGRKSIQPLGTLFEQSAQIYLDTCIILLMQKLKKSEESMRKKHTTLE